MASSSLSPQGKCIKMGSQSRCNSNRTAISSRMRRPERSKITLLFIALATFLSSFDSQSSRFAIAANDDYYGGNNYDDGNYNNNANGDDNYNANGDDGYNNGNGDDYYNQNQNANGDDYGEQNGDDYYAYQNDGDDNFEQGDDNNNYAANQNVDDDVFHWSPDVGFDGVSVMPISCINYNNGHMIKFQLFDSAQSYQCHFAEISTFVVSIAHYMRAYFNYQALTEGQDFELPEDAAYLNCIQLQESAYADMPLYAKIGCMERETFTSTKLQLHVYTDAQCSQPYNDYQSAREHARKGFQVGDELVSSKVSFKPPFYSCLTCAPAQVAGTFSKKNNNWYDDDYISEHGNKQNDDEEEDEKEEEENDQDDYFDDQYYSANDDVNRDDDAMYNYQNDDNQNNNNNGYYGNNGDDYYAAGDDYYGGRFLTASEEDIQTFKSEFWNEVKAIKAQRSLYDNYYNAGEWNMCQRIYKYGVWCDQECRSLDFFRRDQWSASDVFLLAIMTTFMTAMMLLVIAKRLKAQQRARIYGEDQPMPGLPPFAMVIIFFVILAVIVTLAKLKFINETLVFAVVTCTLLFIYMLKLTLFENRRPVLLAAPRHDMFDNPLDDNFIE